MQKSLIDYSEIKLVGLTARTNNAAEMNPATAKIGLTMQRFFTENFSAQIQNRKNPGTTFAVYTNYESDFTGDYTYFIGEEVTTFEAETLETLTIPAQSYAKFTSNPGPMPQVVIDMWQHIWKAVDLGGERAYIADFEVYDSRSYDLQQAVVDIYLGLKR